ncbi:MAG TPA: type II secretion system protein [Solirubrobacteraceae bacterium]|nr:type II secretion system protein [Solirubrobacteraceae bacterium]
MPLDRRSSLDTAGERGFTIVELLVVILIIAVLAVVATPAFLSQPTKATDASANTNTRTASCFALSRDHAPCPTQSALGDDGIHRSTGQALSRRFGPPGTVTLGYSRSGNIYGIVITPSHTIRRICQTPSGTYPNGSCHAGGAYSAAGLGTW